MPDKIIIATRNTKISKIFLIVFTIGLTTLFTSFIWNVFSSKNEELYMTQFANYQLRLGSNRIKFENDSLKIENASLKLRL